MKTSISSSVRALSIVPFAALLGACSGDPGSSGAEGDLEAPAASVYEATATDEAAFTSACESGDRTARFRLPFSLVRVVHASPDAPPVDVYVRGLPFPVLRSVKFTEATRYLVLPAGTYTVDLRAAGARATDAPAYSTGPLTIPRGARITALAAGLLGSRAPGEAFRILPLVEDFQQPGAGKTAVRVVHASADAPTVGIDVGNDDPARPEVSSLARFADTGAAGIPLPANAPLQLGIAAGGATVTAFTTPALPECAGLFVIATGLLGKLPRQVDGFGLLAVGPRGTLGFLRQNPTVYALHASPDAPAVDVFAGPARIVAQLSFGQLSRPVQVPPGDYTLDFFGASASATRPGSPAATAAVPGLRAGERYLAVATGFLAPRAGDAAFRVLPLREGFDVQSLAEPRARVLHASPDAPPVDIGLVSGGALTSRLVTDLTFGASTPDAGLAIPPATLQIGVAATGQSHPVATFSLGVPAGLKGFVVAGGALDASRGKGFRLLVVNSAASPWTVGTVSPN